MVIAIFSPKKMRKQQLQDVFARPELCPAVCPYAAEMRDEHLGEELVGEASNIETFQS